MIFMKYSSSPRPSISPKFQSSGLCFCTDLSKRQGPWTPVMSLASIGHAADPESAARDRRQVPLDRTVTCSALPIHYFRYGFRDEDIW